MKNFLLLTLMLFVLTANPLLAQYNNVDFESGGLGAAWAWTMDQNGSNPPLNFIANPVSGGANTTATVAEFTAEVAGQPWALTYTDDIDEFIFDATNSTITIMVYKPEISDVGIKFEGASAPIELKVANTLVNQWEMITFDFTGSIGNTYNRLVILPDFHTRAQTNTIYLDEIQIPTGNVAPPAEPMVDAPDPTHDETLDNVISIFSDTYTDVSGTDFNPNWGQTTIVTTEMIQSNPTLKYANLTYQGTQFGSAQDVSTNEFIHIDFWTSNATALDFFLISASSGEQAYSLTADIVANQWVSVDIPLSHFSNLGLDLTDIHQFKVTGNGNVWFDNWYFYGSTAPPPVVEPTTAAPTPMHACVTSVFSDVYTDLVGTDFNPNWGQATAVSTEIIASDNTMKYGNLNYQGTQLPAAQDVSGYEFLHVDFWTGNSTALNFFLISGAWPSNVEASYSLTGDIVAEQWVSVDIPLSSFGAVDLTDVTQFKVDGNGNIWFDNWYFHSGGSANLTASGTGTANCTEACTSGTWSYYETAPDDYAIAIDWGVNNAAAKAAATVSITADAAATSMDDGTGKTWSMARYWNVDIGAASLVNPVSVKFFYDLAEKTAIETAMNTDGRAAAGFKWFKTVGVAFDPAVHVMGPGVTGDAIELTDSNTGGLTESGVAYAQFDGITSFSGGSGATGAGSSAILPVNLNYFRAKADNQQVDLTWETALEWNNDYFEVQRSIDGREFVTIDMVQGAGNSNEVQNYQTIDKSPLNGANYYRLKQVDFDGRFVFSSIQKVDFRNGDISNTVFPNPATEKVNIIFAAEASNAQIQIYSLTGQMLLEYQVSEGAIQQSLDLSKLGKGVYRLNIQNNGTNETHSIVLL